MFSIRNCLVMVSLIAATVAFVEAAPDQLAIREFMERVQRYVDIRTRIERSLPALSSKEEDPAEIISHEKKIASEIRSARTEAFRGDVFIPRVQPILLKMINDKLGPTARGMIMGEGNPKNETVKVDLTVNASYPSATSLSTVPSSVLLRLPTLPKGVEYRFVGRHLILYDAKASLIIDVLPNAIHWRTVTGKSGPAANYAKYANRNWRSWRLGPLYAIVLE